MPSEKYKKGLAKFREVYPNVPVADGAEQDAWMKTMLENAFASIWARDGLSVRELRLVVLGITSALGIEEVFELQCRNAVQRGELTPDQVMELLLFLPQYIGFPRAAGLRARMQKAFPEAMARAEPD